VSLRARRQQRARPPVIADVNLSPLIDMVFILLIFFIVTTVFVEETAIEVERPAAESAQKNSSRSILFAIDHTGQVFHEDAPTDLERVNIIVRRLLRGGERPVVLVADQAVTAARLVEVIDAAKLAGASSVSIATQPEDAQP